MAIVLIAGLLASTYGCASQPPYDARRGEGVTDKGPIDEPDASVDEYLVYSALIEKMYLHSGVDSVVIINEPINFPSQKDDLERTFRLVNDHIPGGIPNEVLDDFKRKSQQGALFLNRFTARVTCELISKDEVNELYRGGWVKFWEKHPNRGIISFSRVGFTKDQKVALVYTGTQSGGKSGSGYYVLLTREGDSWMIKHKVEVWVS